MSLPLAKNHKQVINQVWEKYKLDSLRMANGSAEARYKIVDEDYDKFLKPWDVLCLTQSWLQQAVSSQIAKFDNLLKANCQQESYDKFKEEVGLGSLSNMVQMAQDASMETLDLEARQIANITLARLQLWLAKTRWSEDVKDQVRGAPISGDGKLSCRT